MVIELMGISGKFTPAHPKGQIQWIVPGVYQWTVPAGVISVCCLVVSAGGEGGATTSTATGGAGGGVRWSNDIPVTPGETYRIVVGSGGVSLTSGTQSRSPNGNLTAAVSSALGIEAGLGSVGTAFSPSVGGGYGGSGGRFSTGSSTSGAGGWAGRYTNGTTPSRNAANDGLGVKGILLNSNNFSVTPDYGGGGSAILSVSKQPYSYAGAGGAVRIIWGNGRGYPASGIEDK